MTIARSSLLPLVLLVCSALPLHSALAEEDWDASAGPARHLVSIGHDAFLAKGEHAEVVVAVLGSATAEGEVSDSVVSVAGDTRVTGAVGRSAVAVLGDVYVNSRVSGDVVAVLGNVTLGPQAHIDGQVVEVLGTLDRNAAAVIEGGTIGVLSGLFGGAAGLHAWIHECLLYARPLAPDVALGWIWGLAIAALAFYLLVGALFHEPLRRCVQTLDAHPGPSILAALIAIALMPVLTLVLAVTVIGIVLIPFCWVGLFCLGLFGRVVALGWLGSRCLRLSRSAAAPPPVLSVLVGGVIVLALYMVPVLGFLAYALLGLIGFGAVMYSLLLGARASRGRPAPEAAQQSQTAADMPPPSSSPPPTGVEPHVAITHPRAGFWVRMGALLLDLILVGFALGLFFHHGFRGTLLILAAYAAIMWKLRGTTVGGIVFDLQVVRLDGRPIDWGTAIVRALACFLSLAVAGLGFLWIAVDVEHQAWHDKIAGTVVVRLAKGVALV